MVRVTRDAPAQKTRPGTPTVTATIPGCRIARLPAGWWPDFVLRRGKCAFVPRKRKSCVECRFSHIAIFQLRSGLGVEAASWLNAGKAWKHRASKQSSKCKRLVNRL
jgi:hypothetical protein